MKRFWISWYQPTKDYRPLIYPPNEAILGWWYSGMGKNGRYTICALVQAENETNAADAVLIDWPDAEDWRFCRIVENAFEPGDRFPLDDWMVKRIFKISA